MLRDTGRSHGAEAAGRRALVAFEETGFGRGAVTARITLALTLAMTGRPAEAAALLQHAEQIAETLDDDHLLAEVYGTRGCVECERGDVAAGVAYLQRGLSRAGDHLLLTAMVRHDLAYAAVLFEDYPRAREHLADALAIARQLGPGGESLSSTPPTASHSSRSSKGTRRPPRGCFAKSSRRRRGSVRFGVALQALAATAAIAALEGAATDAALLWAAATHLLADGGTQPDATELRIEATFLRTALAELPPSTRETAQRRGGS